MNDKHLAQLEAQLEKITEGIFARFFGRRVQVHDIALQLLRALENGLRTAQDGDTRSIAPDRFTIQVNTEVLEHILNHYPALDQALSSQIAEIAHNASYRLRQKPEVRFIAMPDFTHTQIAVTAEHIESKNGTTAAMKPIKLATAHAKPVNAQLIISGERSIALTQPIVHLGRERSNDIILDDLRVSREHAQIRLRFGHYMIFDTDSAGGTYVNNVRIREHRLQPGDVIRIGQTSLVYIEEDQEQDSQTQSIDPVP